MCVCCGSCRMGGGIVGMGWTVGGGLESGWVGLGFLTGGFVSEGREGKREGGGWVDG